MRSEKNKLYWLISIATFVRIAVALSITLGNDEVYYLTYAQHLQWNYFDHPPMVALLVRLTTLDLLYTSDLFVRLGSIVLAAINTYLVFMIASKIKNERAGFIAALLFTASLYSSVISGIFILPDTPQLFFWIMCLYLLIRIVSSSETDSSLKYNLIGFGILSGLCIMSKVHGVFLWFGFGLYIVLYRRKLLSNFYLYFSVFITACIVSPILFWNIENNFITYSFHSDRVVINNGIDINSFIREFVGGILYNNPINYWITICTLVALWKTNQLLSSPINRILVLTSLPLIGVVLFISLFRATLPHWSGPAYVTLLLLVATSFEDTKAYFKPKIFGMQLVKISVGFLACICLLASILINYLPGTIGNKEKETLGQGDPTLDMYDWDYFKDEFAKIQQKEIKKNSKLTSFVINNKWFPGSHIDNYIVQPLHLDFVAIGQLEDIHTYAWLNNYRKKMQIGDDAYFITFSNSFSDPHEFYLNQFNAIQKPISITQYRNNKPARVMYVYLLKGFKG